jgi:hypothetical protein
VINIIYILILINFAGKMQCGVIIDAICRTAIHATTNKGEFKETKQAFKKRKPQSGFGAFAPIKEGVLP